jgi:hypothetical protein
MGGVAGDLWTKEGTHCGKHARDGEETHVRPDGGDCGRFVVPPPDTGGGEPGGRYCDDDSERCDECPGRVAAGQETACAEETITGGI